MIKGKRTEELETMSHEDLSAYFAEICMAGRNKVFDYSLVVTEIQDAMRAKGLVCRKCGFTNWAGDSTT
jgi:hypothetical protein